MTIAKWDFENDEIRNEDLQVHSNGYIKKKGCGAVHNDPREVVQMFYDKTVNVKATIKPITFCKLMMEQLTNEENFHLGNVSYRN